MLIGSRGITEKLRLVASWFWAIGLGIVGLDFLTLHFLSWKISLSYVAFIISFLLLSLAEKREFGMRQYLYRLHDTVFSGPWKFLLLYFLWISISSLVAFSLSTFLFVINGWISLFSVALGAQFLFCERSGNRLLLLPSRLGAAFRIYASILFFLLSNTILHLVFPSFPLPLLVEEQANLIAYFLLGSPFLFWDLAKKGRYLLWRPFNFLLLVIGVNSVFFFGGVFHWLSLIFIILALSALFLLKFYHKKRVKILLTSLLPAAFLFALLILFSLNHFQIELPQERAIQLLVENRLVQNFRLAWVSLQTSPFMGLGAGNTAIAGAFSKVLAEAGVVGFSFFIAFFLSLFVQLVRSIRSNRAASISIISFSVFMLFLNHYSLNPYSAFIWVWCSLWTLFSSTNRKRKV